jgi:hypothetical protein
MGKEHKKTPIIIIFTPTGTFLTKKSFVSLHEILESFPGYEANLTYPNLEDAIEFMQKDWELTTEQEIRVRDFYKSDLDTTDLQSLFMS